METLSLGQISFKNYKNLDDDQIQLQRLNLLIGPNGSGKSNLVGLMRFFKQAMTELPSEARRISQLEGAILHLGGNYILDASLDPPARVNLSYSLVSPENGKAYRYTLDLLVQGPGKEIVPKEETFNEFIGINQDNVQTLSYSPSTPTPLRQAFIDSLSSWQFYNANQMSLEVIRSSEPKLGPSDRFLSASGDNLPLVFENLSQEYLEFEETITSAMREILPWTKKVRAVRSGRLGLIIEWSFQPPNGKMEQFYLTEMSDGSVRMLSWAIALLSPEPASLLVIEEPEIGIHVAWMPALAKWIKEASNHTQLIVSTHSPDLLDQFTDMLPNLLVFQESSSRKNRFAINRLQPEKISDRIKQGWQVGDLYRVGDPDVGGWPW